MNLSLGWKWSESVSYQLCLTPCDPMTVACQAPLSAEFSRQEHWSGLTFPSPGNFPYPGTEPGSPALQARFLLSEPPVFNLKGSQMPRGAIQSFQEGLNLMFIKSGALRCAKDTFQPIYEKQNKLLNLLLHFSKNLTKMEKSFFNAVLQFSKF